MEALSTFFPLDVGSYHLLLNLFFQVFTKLMKKHQKESDTLTKRLVKVGIPAHGNPEWEGGEVNMGRGKE